MITVFRSTRLGVPNVWRNSVQVKLTNSKNRGRDEAGGSDGKSPGNLDETKSCARRGNSEVERRSMQMLPRWIRIKLLSECNG